MGFGRLSFTEKRRRKLAMQVDRIDRLEPRTTITEPISITGLSISALRGLVQLGIMHPYGGSNAASGLVRPVDFVKQSGRPVLNPLVVLGDVLKPIPGLETGRHTGATGGSSGAAPSAALDLQNPSNDWLTLNAAPAGDASDAHGISTPWQPAKRLGGGAIMAPRGGTSAARGIPPTSRGAITPLTLPASAPAAISAGGASAALLAAVAGASGAGTGVASANEGGALEASRVSLVHAAADGAAAQSIPPGNGGSGLTLSPDGGSGGSGGSSGGAALPGSTPDLVTGNSSTVTDDLLTPSAPFNLSVLDNNNGVVLYPNVEQLATLGGYVDLVAQVSGATVSSYDWNTSGLTDANTITGTATYDMSFLWNATNLTTAHTDSVTLSVTDSSSQVVTLTYDFWVPYGSGTSHSGGTNDTWPTSLAPSQELDSAPAFPSDNASVDATSGSLDTEIDLPSYNPNVPAIALAYDSLAANPEPIITFENTIPATVPSQVSAQLTFDGGTPLTTYYYSTSGLNPGDVQQIALQATNATSLATNRYTYSGQLVDIGSGVATMTFSGGTNLLNYSGNSFGAGWTLQGLEQVIPETGGVILDLGDDGRSLWFTGSPGSGGGTYTDPAGEFSTLAKNSSSGGGGYTQTLTDGDKILFNSSGQETATVDLSNQHITYTYSGSNLSTITDNYGNTTTFSYSGGYLQSITDPASRITTLTHSGGNLTQAELPDGSTLGYAYGSGSQLTKITDARSNSVTISYDSASRVGTITRPDSTKEEFTNDQESGWTNSGTSLSPASSTLLAQAGGTYTSPNGNATTIQPDWLGMGLPGNIIDPLGNDQLFDRNSNGLATVTVDQVNRNTQFSYDSKGNVTSILYEDANSESYTYNTDSQPLTSKNADGNTTSYTYSGGNLVVIEDALLNLTSMTYTSTGRLQTSTDANNHTTTYLYDSQDRLTTVQFSDGTTNLYSYNSQGDVTKSVDGRSNATTYSYDAMNRQTGSTNALGGVTTLTYDSGGNLIEDQEPTPAGQTARTTTYAYDSMDRQTTVTDPLGYQTIYGFDADGNNVTVTDPMLRVTTTVFDALDRPTVSIDPMSGRTTTTYDGDSEVIQVVDPLGRTTTTAYDNHGWVANVTDPLGNVATYSYTATGKASTVTNPGQSGGSSIQSYFYDKDDRLIADTDANGNTVTYTLDGVGNEIGFTDANNHGTSYAYDSMNRLTTVTDSLGDTTVYGYDSGGNQITQTDGLGHTVTTQYDALDRATTIISAVSGTTTITYDAAGRETSLTDPDGNKTQWAYNADDQVTTQTLPNAATVTYVYDKDGELTDTTE